MTPENRHPQTPATKEVNPGIIPVEEGGERPHAIDAPSVQDVNTGEIPALIPEHSGELILTDEERRSKEFQNKTDYYKQSVDTAPKKRRALLLGGAAAAAVALAAGLFAGAKSNENTGNTPAPTQPVATAPAATAEATPIKTETPATTGSSEYDPATAAPLETAYSGELFDNLSAEQQAKIKTYADMPLETFRTLPVEEQLVFGQFILDNITPAFKYNLESNGAQYKEYADEVVAPSKDNTGQEISDINSFTLDASTALILADGVFDEDSARKMLSLSTSTLTGNFKNIDSFLDNTPEGFSYSRATVTGYKTYVEGNTTYAKVNQENETGGNKGQVTYRLVEFQDIKGATRLTWQQTLAVGPSDSRFDSSIS